MNDFYCKVENNPKYEELKIHTLITIQNNTQMKSHYLFYHSSIENILLF
jgi:hypothetical protein